MMRQALNDLIAVLRTIKYGDVYDRSNEYLQIAGTTAHESCTLHFGNLW
jgi:hypothetical protein